MNLRRLSCRARRNSARKEVYRKVVFPALKSGIVTGSCAYLAAREKKRDPPVVAAGAEGRDRLFSGSEAANSLRSIAGVPTVVPSLAAQAKYGGRAGPRRVGVWRGGFRLSMSVTAPFVWRCLSGSTMAPFPHPPHRTGHADFLHPALGQDLTPSSTARRAQADPDVRARSARRGARVDSSRPFVA